MARHESSYLELVQELPPLPTVSGLIIHGGAPRVRRELHPRYISAKAALRIVEACPFVDRIELQLSDMESKNLTQRNNEREACARALGSVPSTVTHMQLHYPGVIPQNQLFDPPIIPTFQGKDLFSCAMNKLSQQLESLHLFAVVSDDLFDITSPTTHWPKLRNLHVDFDVAMPNGTWMIDQEPEDPEPEINSDEDMEYDDLRTYDDWSDHEMPASSSMSFNDLPPAILTLIAVHLLNADLRLSPYATINKSWNTVIEAVIFRELRSESLDHLAKIPDRMNPDRWEALRALDIIIQLPEYDRKQWHDLETQKDKNTNNAVFSDSLREIFATINSWQQYKSGPPRMTLAIQAISKSDYCHLDMRNRIKRHGNAAPGMEDVRTEASYLHFLGSLPNCPTVSSLVFRGARLLRQLPGNPTRPCCPRLLSGESVIGITRACPSVNRIELELSDQESKNLELRNRERADFAVSLLELPHSVTQVKLHYPGVVPANQLFDPPSIPLVNGKDLFSHNLSTISRNLENLEIKAVLSDDFFELSDSNASWPRLRSLHISLEPCTPAGEWMLELDQEDTDIEPDDDEDEQYEDLAIYRKRIEMPARMHFPLRSFRTVVDRDLFDDVSLAAAKALTKMPNMRDFKLDLGDEKAETGCLCSFTSDGRLSHKAIWQSRSATMYEPHADVIAAWKQLFEEKIGELEIQVLGYEHSYV
ncbi:hypothetical protein KCU99_g1085, partial [Aureobasidium melanogenum]